jgi:neprosin-like protein
MAPVGRRWRFVFPVLVGLVCAPEAFAQQPPQSGARAFETFASFIERTRRATIGQFRERAETQVRDGEAFEEMKAHVLKLYDGVTVKHSFADDAHFVDCVPRNQQPGVRSGARVSERPTRPATPPKTERPSKPPGTARTLDLTLRRGKKDTYGNEQYCPAGTIPMRRVTLDEIVRFPTLRDFLRGDKIDDGSLDDKRRQDLPGDSSSHYYARGAQFVDNLGGASWLNVWSPTVSSHRMSLSQIWVVGGEGESKQTVEGGWQVYPDKWGTDKAALFIFYTTKGYQDGCYNLDCTAFVQTANNVYLGKGFTNYSSNGGTQWVFRLQWKRNTDGNWWLFYQGPGNYIPVGYYPKSLFGTGQMASKANKIAFGGEDTGKPSAKQMGSGNKAADGWQKAAFQNRAFYIDTGGTSRWADLTKYEPDPTCYTATINNIFGSWGTYLYFGGPSCN